MNEAKLPSESSRKDRDAELQALLDSCPDEVLLLLLQLIEERDRKPAPLRRQ